MGMKRLIKRLKREEQGQILLGVALSMMFLLGMGAFVLDYGLMAVQKTQLQNAADAAALAGAQSIHLMTETQLALIVADYAEKNVEDGFINETPEVTITQYDRMANTLSVRVTQTAGKVLSGLFSEEEITLTAEATAKMTRKWDGEALPFLNYQIKPEVSGTVILWSQDSNSPQVVDRVDKKEYELIQDPATLRYYYKLEYENGVDLQNGVASDIKAGMSAMISNGMTQYLLSVSPEAFAANTYKTITNRTVIPLKDLVLMKVNVKSYEDNGAMRNLTFTIEEIYDIGDGKYPETAMHSERFNVRLIR